MENTQQTKNNNKHAQSQEYRGQIHLIYFTIVKHFLFVKILQKCFESIFFPPTSVMDKNYDTLSFFNLIW